MVGSKPSPRWSLSKSPRNASRQSKQRASTMVKKASVDTDGSEQPQTIALIQQMALSIRVVRREGHVQYELRGESSSSDKTWTLPRPFRDYKRFRNGLLKLLQIGHFCSADCPWLRCFLKEYFPKKRFFLPSALNKVTESRARALERVLRTLQSFLLDSTNHGCQILVEIIAPEFLQFVQGDSTPLLSSSACSSQSTDCIDRMSESARSSPGVGSERSIVDGSASDNFSLLLMCEVCRRPLAHSLTPEMAITIRSPRTISERPKRTPTSKRSSVSRQRSCSYSTVLSCGHEFHDECIVEHLNTSLACPTCGEHPQPSRETEADQRQSSSNAKTRQGP